MTYKAFDAEFFKKINDKFKETAKQVKSRKSSRILLHHRKASMGVISKKNVHPIKVGDYQYIHNGSVWDINPLRAWLEYTDGVKFETDTDTEVLGYVLEHFYQDVYKNNPEHGGDVLDHMMGLFGDFGVLIRVNTKTQEMEIFKTTGRELWFYTDETDVLMISEPIPHIADYNNLYLMNEGYYKLDGTIDFHEYPTLFTDYSQRMEESIADWSKAVNEQNKKLEKRKCGLCLEEKNTTLELYAPANTLNVYKTWCFSCWVKDNVRVK